MKQLDRLIFIQGGLCFFCRQPLSAGDASVEHLLASANGGTNGEENCVACCKALNALLGDKSLKEKLQVVLNQRGQFNCPKVTLCAPMIEAIQAPQPHDRIAIVVADLQKRGSARPRKVATLRNTINAALKKQLTEEEISSVMERLQARGIIAVSGTKVTYALPSQNV